MNLSILLLFCLKQSTSTVLIFLFCVPKWQSILFGSYIQSYTAKRLFIGKVKLKSAVRERYNSTHKQTPQLNNINTVCCFIMSLFGVYATTSTEVYCHQGLYTRTTVDIKLLIRRYFNCEINVS